ncbi:MAG: carbohydrate ABC transporter permease [Actinomycetota bacterium]
MSRLRRLAWPATALAVSVAFLLPLAVAIAGSFRGEGLPPPRGIEILPATASLDGYRSAFSLVPLARALANSLAIAAIAVPLAVGIAALAGYAIARAGRRARGLGLGVQLGLLLVPVSALWLGRFAIFSGLGVTDTWIPLIAPALMGGSPLFVLLFWLAFRRIPSDIFDAALLEGASHARVWRRVAMPMVRSTTAAVGLLAFSLSWGNFIDPLLYLNSEHLYTAPLMLRSLEQLGPTNWPVVLAGATLVTLPALAALSLALRAIAPRRGGSWIGS